MSEPQPAPVLAPVTAASVPCMWFALCENTTTEAADHPVLGPTPICKRCAAKLGIVPAYDLIATPTHE